MKNEEFHHQNYAQAQKEFHSEMFLSGAILTKARSTIILQPGICCHKFDGAYPEHELGMTLCMPFE